MQTFDAGHSLPYIFTLPFVIVPVVGEIWKPSIALDVFHQPPMFPIHATPVSEDVVYPVQL